MTGRRSDRQQTRRPGSGAAPSGATSPEPLTAIRNIGTAMAASLMQAGIADAAALRALGPDVAYARLLASGHKAHFIAYYALVMGLQGRPWNDCIGAEKSALRDRFDRLKSAHAGTRGDAGGLDAIEAMLDRFGVIAPARSGRRGS